MMNPKNKKPLKTFIKSILGKKNIDREDPVLLIGLSILFIAQRRNDVGIEIFFDESGDFHTPDLEDYLEFSEIPHTQSHIDRAYKILEKNKLLKDGVDLNIIGSEDAYEKPTWLLWANVLSGLIKREIKDNEAQYKLTPRGIKIGKAVLEKMNK